MGAIRLLLLVAAVALIAAACSSSTTPATTDSSSAPTTVPLNAVPTSYPGYLHQPTACGADQPNPAVDMKFDAPGDADLAGMTTVILNTSCGPLEIAMDPGVAPETVNSFVFLAEQGYFDGTVSHRILPGYLMQAGDPTATGLGGPGYTIPDEVAAGANYTRGVVAMANAGPDTAGSQFFILFGDAERLPPQYTIFGEVVSGFDVLDAIERLPRGRGANSADVQPSTPLESLFIESITIKR